MQPIFPVRSTAVQKRFSLPQLNLSYCCTSLLLKWTKIERAYGSSLLYWEWLTPQNIHCSRFWKYDHGAVEDFLPWSMVCFKQRMPVQSIMKILFSRALPSDRRALFPPLSFFTTLVRILQLVIFNFMLWQWYMKWLTNPVKKSLKMITLCHAQKQGLDTRPCSS